MKTILSSLPRSGKWDLSAISDGQRIGLRSHVELASETLSFVYRLPPSALRDSSHSS